MTITQPTKDTPYFKAAPMSYLKVELTSAEVLALNTAPQTIIASPGAGKAIKVNEVIAKSSGGTAYATNVGLQVITDTADDAQFANSIVLTSTAERTLNLAPVASTGATSKQIIADKALLAKVATGNPATGTGTLTLYVAYQIVTL